MRKHKLVSLTIAFVLVAIMAIGWIVTAPQRRFRQFLAAAAEVKVGKTNQAEFLSLLKKKNFSDVVVTCKQDTCNLSWHSSNTLLHRFRLAPLTTVEGSVLFDGHQIASDIYIWVEVQDEYDSTAVARPGTGATVHQNGRPEVCNKGYSAELKQNGSKKWGTVVIDSCATADSRTRTFAINSKCLSKIGGCTTVGEIIPGVFTHL
jgi:hypothetical protein